VKQYLKEHPWARWLGAVGCVLVLALFFLLIFWLDAMFGMAGPLAAGAVVVAGVFVAYFYLCITMEVER